LPETHRQLDALDEEIALSRNQLAALAGKGPGEGAQLQRPTLSLGAPLKLPSSLPAELLGQRPDVVASRWQVAAQARGIDVAHAGFYPNVDLVGSLGYVATGGGMLEFLTGKKLNYSVGPAITLPIFDGGRLRSQLGEASAGYDIAVARYNQTLVNALKGISDQLIRRESMDKQQGFAAESVASAQKTYDIAMIAYQRGLTDYLNVLNAQSLLFRQQQVQQQVAQQTAQLKSQLASSGNTDSSALDAGLQQIQNNAATLTQQLQQGNVSTATAALSSVQSTYTNLLNQALSDQSFGFGAQSADVQLQVQSNTQLSASLNQLFGALAQGFGTALGGNKSSTSTTSQPGGTTGTSGGGVASSPSGGGVQTNSQGQIVGANDQGAMDDESADLVGAGNTAQSQIDADLAAEMGTSGMGDLADDPFSSADLSSGFDNSTSNSGWINDIADNPL